MILEWDLHKSDDFRRLQVYRCLGDHRDLKVEKWEEEDFLLDWGVWQVFWQHDVRNRIILPTQEYSENNLLILIFSWTQLERRVSVSWGSGHFWPKADGADLVIGLIAKIVV